MKEETVGILSVTMGIMLALLLTPVFIPIIAAALMNSNAMPTAQRRAATPRHTPWKIAPKNNRPIRWNE